MRARLVAILLLSFATVAGAQGQIVVEDWTKPAVGTKGLPPDWKAQNWGSPKYDFEIVTDENQRALRMKSANEGSLASRDIKGKVNLKETPILEWSWKVMTLPKNGDSCKKATDDQAAQVYVVWPRFPEAVRSRVLGYVWDTTEPVGTVCKSEKTRHRDLLRDPLGHGRSRQVAHRASQRLRGLSSGSTTRTASRRRRSRWPSTPTTPAPRPNRSSARSSSSDRKSVHPAGPRTR